MISDLSQSILYFCPNCSDVMTKKITAFNFPKDKVVEFECENKNCSIPILAFKTIKDKYKISVVCPICSETHTFYISSKTLWAKDFFILNCPVSGLGILFVGKNTERLMNEYTAQNEVIAGLMAEEDFDESELDLLFQIFERINTLAKNDAITCSCGSDCISIELNVSGISLSCGTCKNKTDFDISQQSLDELMSSDHLQI